MGEISGIYIDAGGTYPRLFPKQEGVFTTLDPPGSVRTQAEFLDAEGEVVGVYRDANQTRHGFTWSKGVFTSFDVPGSAAPWVRWALGLTTIETRGRLRGRRWKPLWLRAKERALHDAKRA